METVYSGHRRETGEARPPARHHAQLFSRLTRSAWPGTRTVPYLVLYLSLHLLHKRGMADGSGVCGFDHHNDGQTFCLHHFRCGIVGGNEGTGGTGKALWEMKVDRRPGERANLSVCLSDCMSSGPFFPSASLSPGSSVCRSVHFSVSSLSWCCPVKYLSLLGQSLRPSHSEFPTLFCLLLTSFSLF